MVGVETEVTRVGDWRFVKVAGVPLIERVPTGYPNRLRLSFLRFLLPRFAVYAPLRDYAFEMGRMWGGALTG